MKKTAKTWAGIPKGTPFKVISNCNSHNYPMGVVLKTNILCDGHSGSVIEGFNVINVRDVEFIPTTIIDLKEELKNLEEKVQEIKEKIEFCETVGMNEFDEDYYKIYNTLSILETKKTKKEKTALIKNLIKNI